MTLPSPVDLPAFDKPHALSAAITQPAPPASCFLWLEVVDDIDLRVLEQDPFQALFQQALALAALHLNVDSIACRVRLGGESLEVVFQGATIHMPHHEKNYTHGMLLHRGKRGALPREMGRKLFADLFSEERSLSGMARMLRLQLMQSGGCFSLGAKTLALSLPRP